jgi:hypothetical protein
LVNKSSFNILLIYFILNEVIIGKYIEEELVKKYQFEKQIIPVDTINDDTVPKSRIYLRYIYIYIYIYVFINILFVFMIN